LINNTLIHSLILMLFYPVLRWATLVGEIRILLGIVSGRI